MSATCFYCNKTKDLHFDKCIEEMVCLDCSPLMRFGSVCSGIGAPEVAWSSLGWSPQWFSEIAEFPSSLLAHHYPGVPNHGSLEGLSTRNVCSPVDVIVGGTPCQSFSIAGLRGGLADSRGNLALEFARLVGAVRPLWFVWENVPGVLSSGGGRDFGAIVRALAELGYGLAWRVLDACYFGVPQRRRRVFLVGCAAGAAAAGAVLFEPEGVRRDFAPSKGERKETAEAIRLGTASGCREFGTLMAKGDYHVLSAPDVSHALNAGGTKRNSVSADTYICSAEGSKSISLSASNIAPATNNQSPLVVNARQDPLTYGHHCGPLDTDGGTYAVKQNLRVRRLTPMECERLQGFPDNYTNTPGASDASRCIALGNSMAVPVLKWIGQRIEMVTRILEAQ